MVGGTGKEPRYKLTKQERLLCREALLSDRHARRIRRASGKDRNRGADGERHKKASRKEGAKRTTAAMGFRGALEAAPAPGAALSEAEAKDADVDSAPAEDAPEAKDPASSQPVTADPAISQSVTADPAISQPMTADLAAAEVIADMVTALAGDAAIEQPGPGGNVSKRRRAILEDVSAGEECSSGEDVAAPGLLRMPPPCVVDGDANLMDAGADKCTYLNSDEDLSVEEDREDQDSSEDGDDGDWDIGELTDEETEDGGEDLPESVCNSVAQSKKAISMMRTHGWEYDPEQFGPYPSYEDLYDGSYGPSESVMTVGDDPLALLFYFMPPRLWTQIAIESNRYHTQSIPLRARAIRSQQRRAGLQVEDLADIRSRLARVPDIEPWEVLRVMGLLIAQMLMPIRKGIAAHWSTKQVGALPTNRCNLFMTKHRFFHIMGYLHFSNNNSPSASVDRVWKIRPVVDVLQLTFARGYRAPPVIGFDEATLPSRSRYNPTRQFNKDKPHKWGTKVFVAAYTESTYCLRIEIYCGAKTNLQTPVRKDNNTGEAAVLRDINALCPPSITSPWRLVITDLFYTSVKLALELLHRRIYLTGTIQTDRSGYAKGIITKRKTKQVNKRKIVVPPQGTIKLAQNKRFPQITAAMWMDHTPVHLLSSEGSRKTGTVMRRVRGEMQPVSAPELVRDYHRWMGGVDVHDQLRMQRYSIQLSYKTRKYYSRHAS